MNIVAIHTISDPANFWQALGSAGELPQGIKVQSMLPSTEGNKAICLWQADSVETVKGLVLSLVGEFSSNEFFVVDAANARGLPG